jgi:hypothetical protein
MRYKFRLCRYFLQGGSASVKIYGDVSASPEWLNHTNGAYGDVVAGVTGGA